MSDMFLDTDNFDFFSLSDITDDERTHAPKPMEPEKMPGVTADSVGVNGGIVDDMSDLWDEEAEERAEEAKADPNLNLSDLADPNAAAEAVDLFTDLADDVPILINGKAMTKAEIATVAEQAERVKQDGELMSDAAKRVDDINRYIVQQYTTHKLSIDSNIDYIQRQMDNADSEIAYGKYARQLQSAKEARQTLDKNVAEQMELHDIQRRDLANYRSNQSLQINSQKIPGWNEQRRASVVQHFAKEKQIDFNPLSHVWTPELEQVFHDAYLYQKSREKVQANALAKVKAKAPRSTQGTANAQRTQAQDELAAKRAAMVNKAKNGGLDERETSDMFKYLID